VLDGADQSGPRMQRGTVLVAKAPWGGMKSLVRIPGRKLSFNICLLYLMYTFSRKHPSWTSNVFTLSGNTVNASLSFLVCEVLKVRTMSLRYLLLNILF
jgi:hypothetical protein